MNKIVPPSTDLIINVSKNVNPDTSERPSPVVMKIFELSSRTIFDTQDFLACTTHQKRSSDLTY
nr:type VI secretion system lipoprotein TssJ [Ningiella sp. W23]